MADGQPSAAQLLLYCDSFASELKLAYPFLGLGAPGETGTLATLAALTNARIVGDGGALPGLGAPNWQAQAQMALAGHKRHCRADVFFSAEFQRLMTLLDQQITSYIPGGWQYLATIGQAHVLDYHLTRLNAVAPATPATPTLNGTLTGVYDPTGALPSVVVGNAPSVAYTLVGAADYNESLPSPAASPTPLVGSQSAYQFEGPGNVPGGVTKMRIYRTLMGNPGGPLYWDQDVDVVAGLPFPVALIKQADSGLRRDISPPAWMQAMMTPEFAAVWAWAFASEGQTQGMSAAGSGQKTFAANGMLSPWNVLLNSASGFVGVGNTASASVFGVGQITGSNTQAWTAGNYALANVPAGNIQGYAGTNGIQARVVAALNGSCQPTISYTYLSAATGQIVQTATGISAPALISTGVVGPVTTFPVPAGTLVLSATLTGVSGTATTGQIVVEGASARAY